MTTASMLPGVPYTVTRGSGALRLHKGQRVTVRTDGALTRSDGAVWTVGWSCYSFAVELDVAGIMERVAVLRRDADALERLAFPGEIE